MESTILICVLFMVLFLVTNIKNKYHILFAGMLAGIVVALSVTLLLATRGSNYTFSRTSKVLPDFSLEFYIYSFIHSILGGVPWNRLVIYRNCGISVYFICLLFFVHSFYQGTYHNKAKYGLQWIILISYPVLFFIFFHPNSAYHIYIHYHKLAAVSPADAQKFARLVCIADDVVSWLGVLYLLYPLLYLLSKGRKNQISFFAEQLMGVGISLGLFNATMINIFFFHSLRMSAEKMIFSGYWAIAVTEQLPFYYNVTFPIIIAVSLGMSAYFTLMFGINSMIGLRREYIIRQNLNKMYLNLRDVFHANKNLFFSIQKLCELAIADYGSEASLEALQKIRTISDTQFDTLTKSLNYIKKINLKNTTTDLIEVLETAIKEIENQPNIEVIRNYSQSQAYCFLDAYHLTSAISNILHNSCDAIAKKGEEKGIIRINLSASNDWLFCSITDNGCGSSEKLLKKHMFGTANMPIRPNHYGMGLPYIYQVIQAHGGHIKYRTRQNEFTTVEILIPQMRHSKNLSVRRDRSV